MTVYSVCLVRTVTESIVLTIVADDRLAAEEEALDQADPKGWGVDGWDKNDGSEDDVRVSFVEEVALADESA